MAETPIKVIIAAGGIGSRMGVDVPKQLLPFRGSTVIEHTLSLFSDYPVWIAIPPAHRGAFEACIGSRAQLIEGGATRFESVRNAFMAIDPDDGDWIVIHDAARPFFDPKTLPDAISLAQRNGAVIYAQRATDTIKWAPHDHIEGTLDRNAVFLAQTPQVFRAKLLRQAYATDHAASETITDEANLLERSGFQVAIYPSPKSNSKITFPEDLPMTSSTLRIGHGYDVHRFDAQRPLYLCGVEVPGGPGLLGHSDADVAIHAVIDALLGAAGKGDIGHWFPDNDPQFEGIRSTELLQRVWSELSQSGFELVNIDITIQAQVPRLAQHIQSMRSCLADTLAVQPSTINVKATTTEGLGFVGEKLGMAADAVVLLNRVS